MYVREAIVKRILELAKEKGMNLSTWSIKAGMPSSTLYTMKQRGNSCPTIETVKLLCDGIGMELWEFFNADYIQQAEVEDKR